MTQKDKVTIRVEATIHAPLEHVWKLWTTPEHIKIWNTASEDWHTTEAEVDLREGGRFSSRMEARDGSIGFDFWGIYDKVVKNKLLSISLGDGRKMSVDFVASENATQVVEVFEAEVENSIDLQRQGWQTILDNFKKYAENL